MLIRFLLVGVLNTIVGVSSMYAVMFLFGVDYRIANAIGYGIGIAVSFVLNKTWTFQHQGQWLMSLVRWLTVAAVAYMLNLVVVVALHEGAHVNAYLSQLGGVLIYTATAFLGGQLFAFRNPNGCATESTT